MIWGAIFIETRTHPVFVSAGRRREGLTAVTYIEEILAERVVPYVWFILAVILLLCTTIQIREEVFNHVERKKTQV